MDRTVKKYYDLNKLSQLLDLDHLKPEIYMVCGNRTAGKTFAVKNKMIKDFKKKGWKFCVIKRLLDDIGNVSEEYFKDLEQVKYRGETLTEKMVSSTFSKLFLNGEHCGYVVALNGAERIRNRSAIFSDVMQMHFDEFQSENGCYVQNEISKFQSIHTSIARGKGEQSRYVPVYMTSNMVTILNPYYEAFGIGPRLKENTKFLRGHGWVFENTFNKNAADALASSGFGRAFGDSKYMKYAQENVYLNDNMTLIGKPEGVSSYVCTIIWQNNYYAIYEYQNGILYCSDVADRTFPVKFTLLTTDHNENTILVKSDPFVIESFRKMFSYGLFRFKNLKCKEVILHLLSYDNLK